MTAPYPNGMYPNLSVSPGERARFEAMYMPEPNSGCWLWLRYCNRQGYGSFQFRRKPCMAHRFSYFLNFGNLPDRLVVMHKCDNPYCVNPDHLALGTLLENNKDRHAKGRDARGPGHGRSRLSVEIVNSIRSSERSAAELAELYGVHRTTIHRARKGWSWECI